MDFEYHTKIKLHMLAYYLTICSKVHLKAPEKFTYFETHAGDGIVKFPDGTIANGSALIAASSKAKFQCIIVEMNYYQELTNNLKSQLGDFQNVKVLPADCNGKIMDVLQLVPAHYHSLGFVDPTHPGELKWSTLVAISNHTYTYQQTGETRRPEILLNLPINRIKRNAGWLDKPPENTQERSHRETAIQQNNEFFGTEDWQEVWRQAGDLAGFFIDRLAALGYAGVLYTMVDEIRFHVPIYYLVLFVSQKKAQEVLPGMAKGLERWRREDYVREYYKVHDLAKWIK
jgi:three-Cys-motif partner protein